MSQEITKILLAEKDMPRQWYNIQADMPTPLQPPLHPATGQPINPEDLGRIFPMNLVEQEMSTERWIDIPDEVLDKLLLWRPTPLHRARYLEKYLQTPAKIYYKNEGVSPAGSHKPNTAVAQAYYNKQFGIKRITTETGAGQWGSAISLSCRLFGLECKVYMVRVSYDQKPYRRLMMQTWGAQCVPSPSPDTNFGRKMLSENPDSSGSLGIAISEAVEDCLNSEDTRYSLGSVLNHVLLHQTVIGLETQQQLASIGEHPDIIAGCVGGGSNFAGLCFPFIREKINGRDMEIYAVEPTACPVLSKGPFVYDFGDTASTTPLLPMYSLGHGFIPAPIHAGGLRYHGMAPLMSQLVLDGLIKPRVYNQLEAYEAGVIWARTEGYIPAPETNHAIALAIEEARKAKEEGKEKTILISWSGHGLLDLPGYDAFLQGKLTDYVMSDEEIAESVKSMEGLPKPKL